MISYKQQVEQLNKMLADKDVQIAALTEQVQKLSDNIVILTQTITELSEKLNKNSHNSSKPPSSDGLKKVNKKRSLRQSSGKSQGGQKGHTGTTLFAKEPDKVERYLPDNCKSCSNYKYCLAAAKVEETRYVVDVIVKTNVTAHKAVSVICPMQTDCICKGEFPENIKAHVQYGDDLQCLITSLSTVGAVSMNRIKEILSGIFDIPLSTGTINSVVNRVASRVINANEKSRQNLLSCKVSHFDETGTRVDGHTEWVHVASNSEYTYLSLNAKRGFLGMESACVLPSFNGIAVHDCWTPYWKYDSLTHAVCNAHLLRELNGAEENHKEQKWAKEFKSLLLYMKKVRDKAVAKGKTALSYYHLHKIDTKYDAVLKTAYEENPLPDDAVKKRGRKKKGKARALIERLEKYKDSICLFIKDFDVPFDNNQAERDLRMIKVKTKVSGCFRTKEGAKSFLEIMSYVGTAKKHGLNAYTALRNAMNGNSDCIFEYQGC